MMILAELRVTHITMEKRAICWLNDVALDPIHKHIDNQCVNTGDPFCLCFGAHEVGVEKWVCLALFILPIHI